MFSGISTFGRLPYQPCLSLDDVDYDLAFIGSWFYMDLPSSFVLTQTKVPLSIPERHIGQELGSAPRVSARGPDALTSSMSSILYFHLSCKISNRVLQWRV